MITEQQIRENNPDLNKAYKGFQGKTNGGGSLTSSCFFTFIAYGTHLFQVPISILKELLKFTVSFA